MTNQISDNKKVDVIVVGSGPAGVSAAITVARGGKTVVLVERGPFSGSKNMYGGVLYTHAVKEIFPNFQDSAPIERYVGRHNYVLLSENDSTTISYQSTDGENKAFVAVRAKWDKWCVEQAMNEGVYFAPNTLVKELIFDDKKVIGIKTDVEEFYADIVILADGVNSLLAEQAGLRAKQKPKHMVLGVKEVIKLPKDEIERRFGLQENEGAAVEFVGGPFAGMFALGILYTNLDSIAVGIGVSLEDLKKKKIKPYDLLQQFKQNASVEKYFRGGELVEYSAHLIPECVYTNIPKLYADGVMVVGDAAVLVNNIHFEGTNFAMMSGKYAGETALNAFEQGDFSANRLCLYEKKLKNSFILKDLKAYKSVIPIVSQRSQSFLAYYPEKVNEFFRIFTTADGLEKKQKFLTFAKSFFTKRSFAELIKDALAGIKIVFSVFR